MRACIVVPTIREESIARFLREWRREFADHTVLVIEDNPSKSFGIDGANVRHYSWTEIDQELGELSWIIPRRTDCIRSFGFYKAYQLQPDFVVSLDDDCYPLDDGFLKQHYARLTQPARSAAWLSTMDGVVPRDVPYHRTCGHRSAPEALPLPLTRVRSSTDTSPRQRGQPFRISTARGIPSPLSPPGRPTRTAWSAAGSAWGFRACR